MNKRKVEQLYRAMKAAEAKYREASNAEHDAYQDWLSKISEFRYMVLSGNVVIDGMLYTIEPNGQLISKLVTVIQ